jgi:hypothetical protein
LAAGVRAGYAMKPAGGNIMAPVTTAVPIANGRPLPDRVRDAARALGCSIVWTRAIGPHVLLGLGDEEAFARVTPLGGNAFGLAFRVDGETETVPGDASNWEPLLLIDDLSDVVEHALIAEGALALEAAGM